jgi:hypothetical protein
MLGDCQRIFTETKSRYHKLAKEDIRQDCLKHNEKLSNHMNARSSHKAMLISWAMCKAIYKSEKVRVLMMFQCESNHFRNGIMTTLFGN